MYLLELFTVQNLNQNAYSILYNHSLTKDTEVQCRIGLFAENGTLLNDFYG